MRVSESQSFGELLPDLPQVDLKDKEFIAYHEKKLKLLQSLRNPNLQDTERTLIFDEYAKIENAHYETYQEVAHQRSHALEQGKMNYMVACGQLDRGIESLEQQKAAHKHIIDDLPNQARKMRERGVELDTKEIQLDTREEELERSKTKLYNEFWHQDRTATVAAAATYTNMLPLKLVTEAYRDYQKINEQFAGLKEAISMLRGENAVLQGRDRANKEKIAGLEDQLQKAKKDEVCEKVAPMLETLRQLDVGDESEQDAEQ